VHDDVEDDFDRSEQWEQLVRRRGDRERRAIRLERPSDARVVVAMERADVAGVDRVLDDLLRIASLTSRTSCCTSRAAGGLVA
jgi:hypothetical protein